MAALWPCPAPIQQPLSLCTLCPGAVWCWAEAAPSPSCPWSSPGVAAGRAFCKGFVGCETRLGSQALS